MEEFHQEIRITYRWRKKGKKTPIPSEHIPTLKTSAEEKITKFLLKGQSHGEMAESVPTEAEKSWENKPKPIEYRGWFQISKVTTHHQQKQKAKLNKSSRSSIG